MIKSNQNIWIVLILSFFIFRVSSYFTINYIYSEELSDFYIPSAIAVALVYWYGPMILIPFFFNAILNNIYWEHENILSWPFYAMPEFVFCLSSWYLFIKLSKGKYWLPNLENVLKFLTLGITVPLIINIILTKFNLIYFGIIDTNNLLDSFIRSFIGDFFAISIFSFFLLYFFSGIFGQKSQIKPKLQYNFHQHIVKLFNIHFYGLLLILSLIILIVLIMMIQLNIVDYWYIYVLFLLIISIKFGFGLTIITNLIIIMMIIIIPAIFHTDQILKIYELSQLIETLIGCNALFVFTFILGRSVSDKRELISSEEKLVTRLRNNHLELRATNKSLLSAKKYFSQLFESSLNLIIIVSEEDGVVVDINEEGYRVLNIDSHAKVNGEVIIWDIMSGKSWEEINNQEDLHSKKFEIALKRNRGTPILCELTVRRIEIEEGRHFIINAVDVTEKRASEEKIRKSNDEKIELNQMISEYKMMALRSAMNPHFIFNCLNSIQFYIVRNEKKEAVHYLHLFSKLVRNVLDNSTKSMVSLATELDILRNYTSLEQMRFNDKFEVEFTIDKDIDQEDTEIPPLLLQPYVENAILHGLSNKNRKGMLNIDIQMEGENLKCTIKDNGVGRKYYKIMKANNPLITTHKSIGMSMTSERINIANKNEQIGVKIIDLKDEEGRPDGTRVEVLISSVV